MRLVAHRGDALERPENTLAAFESALQLGARWLELDVQLSRDQVPMVIHDHELLRTTGQAGSVFDFAAHDLSAISAGEPERFGDQYSTVKLPTLQAAVALIRRTPEARLFVEIKSESLEHFGHELVLQQALKVLENAGPQFIIISFDYRAVQLARQLAGLPIGWVLRRYDAEAEAQCRALAPEFVFCNHTRLPATSRPWQGPWRWASYEVREAMLARRLHSHGVELIETMAVRKMSKALAADLLP